MASHSSRFCASPHPFPFLLHHLFFSLTSLSQREVDCQSLLTLVDFPPEKSKVDLRQVQLSWQMPPRPSECELQFVPNTENTKGRGQKKHITSCSLVLSSWYCHAGVMVSVFSSCHKGFPKLCTETNTLMEKKAVRGEHAVEGYLNIEYSFWVLQSKMYFMSKHLGIYIKFHVVVPW